MNLNHDDACLDALTEALWEATEGSSPKVGGHMARFLYLLTEGGRALDKEYMAERLRSFAKELES